MTTEYRVIFTATFDSQEKRDLFYDQMKAIVQAASGSFVAEMNRLLAEKGVELITSPAEITKRADMTKDSYLIPDAATEKVI